MPENTNTETLFRTRFSGETVFATPILRDNPVQWLGGGYYYVPSHPFALRAGLLVSLRDPSITMPYSQSAVCTFEEFPKRKNCTAIEVDSLYYKVQKKTKSAEHYRTFGDMKTTLNRATKQARNTYDMYLNRGGCCFFLTLTVSREHYTNMTIEDCYAFIRTRLKCFRKGMSYQGNTLHPDGEIYFIERYFLPEPRFHIHAFLFFNDSHNQQELRNMIKKYWHVGRISVEMVDTPEVLDYPGVSIPEKYERLKEAASWLWSNRPPEKDAIRYLNSRMRFYPKNKQAQIIRRKLFSAMYYPRGKSPVAVYGDVSALQEEMTLTLEQIAEIVDPETFTVETFPITDKKTGVKVATMPCIRGILKKSENG